MTIRKYLAIASIRVREDGFKFAKARIAPASWGATRRPALGKGRVIASPKALTGRDAAKLARNARRFNIRYLLSSTFPWP